MRRTFLELARIEPERYLVIEANQSQTEVKRIIRDRFEALLAEPEKRAAK